MNLDPVELYLREKIGLTADSVGRATVERIVLRHLEAAGCADASDYVGRLRTDPAVLQALVEDLVVPETWFFRDRAPFALAARLAQERVQAGARLRLLSLPCATGEEPYSLAIVLLEAGLAPESFRIDALDISSVALAAARVGVYGKNSFRGEEERRREAWFHPHAGGWQVDPRVSAQVTFLEGNVLRSIPPGGLGGYDFVFCRNLLIYFDASTQQAAVRRLQAFLTPSGVLFVGHAEAAILLREGLAPRPETRVFAFTRDAARLTAPPPATVPVMRRPAPAASSSPAVPAPAVRPFADVPLRAPAAVFRVAPAASLLDEAGRLADAGRLDESARLVRAYLERDGSSAGAFYLLGLTRDAQGEEREAEAFYRKAIYLDPTHGEALAHLALLIEKRGDEAAARRLRQRIRNPVATGGAR